LAEIFLLKDRVLCRRTKPKKSLDRKKKLCYSKENSTNNALTRNSSWAFSFREPPVGARRYGKLGELASEQPPETFGSRRGRVFRRYPE
jgi:hypothetical protein